MEIDWELIGGIVSIVTIVGISIAFFVKLKIKVNDLEKKFNEHPLISAYNEYSKSSGAVDFFNHILSNSTVEKGVKI